ncbi:MAG: PTS sugar transporter subunit IIA [Sphingorhabdus sp.]
MIRISTRLVDGAVLADIDCTDKNSLLETLARLASENYGVDARLIYEGLLERERLGPTGFGGGTAIPHCKIEGLDAPTGVFVRLAQPINYQAVDDEPVDLGFALFSPVHDGASHLKALAEVSRMFRDESSCAQLRGARDSAALFALLSPIEERDAA